MKKYLFNELGGKKQGEMIIIEANDANEAFEKSRFMEKIHDGERFSTWTPDPIYELKEFGTNNVAYICR